MADSPPQADSEPPESDQKSASPRTIRFADLCSSGCEVLIEHEGQIYRLRVTRNGKLILNK